MAASQETKRAYLTGSTYRFRATLADKGWRWDPNREAWWKDAEWTDEAAVIRAVRLYGAIRNRGEFDAELEDV